MSRILVTPRSLTAAPDAADLAPLREAGHHLVFGPAGRLPDEAELLDLVAGCAAWLAGTERIPARVLEAAGGLRLICRNGTGVDGIDLAAAARAGIEVARFPGANANAVAELTLALILAAERQILPAATALAGGAALRPRGREIRGRRVGLIGLGAVGGRVAALLAGLGAEVAGHDPGEPALPLPLRRVERIEALLPWCDVLSLHCPPAATGEPLLDAPRLALLPRGARVVNTARAALVDEAALLAALDAGALGWYATDVSGDGPACRALLRHPLVLATPHLGGLTEEAARAVNAAAVARILALLGTARADA